MKRVVILFAISLFLVSFVVAASITSSAIDNSTTNAVGGTCSSVAPIYREACCKDRGYDSWNSEKGTCENETENDSKLTSNTQDEENKFCGTSTYAACTNQSGCMKAGCSNSICQGINEEPFITTCEYKKCYNADEFKAKCGCVQSKCQWVVLGELSKEQIQKIITTRNRIKAASEIKSGECPESCTCTGSTVKCTLANGRNLTIYAGKSGNVIVQVKGENMLTNVTLYKSDGKLYAVFKNNETREVKLLPDQVKEKIRERLAREVENENVSLNNNGEYDYTGTKPAKLFFIFPVNVVVQAQLDPTTGEITTLKTKWWAFLAKDTSQQIVGASCGTVTPGQNDGCCQGRGYNFWNATANECQFSQ